MMKFFVIVFSFILFSACTTKSIQSNQKRNLKISKQWIQSTLNGMYLGPQIVNLSSPLVHDDLVVSANPMDGISAFHKKTGNRIWRNSIKNGVSSGLAIHENTLFYSGNDGQLYAVNLQSGKTQWTFPTQTETVSTPVIDGTSLYLLANNGSLFSINVTTGKLNWSYFQRDNSSMNIRSSSSPSIDENYVYVGFSDGTLAAFDKKTGYLKWERSFADPKSRFKDMDSTPLILGDRIYVATYSGGLYCLKKLTGEILWQNEEGAASALLLHDNKIYYSSSQNDLIAIEASTGKKIWTQKLIEGSGGKPLFYKEMLVLGTSIGPVLFLSIQTGEILAKYSTGWGVSSQPTYDSSSDTLFVSSNYGFLYSLKASWKREL